MEFAICSWNLQYIMLPFIYITTPRIANQYHLSVAILNSLKKSKGESPWRKLNTANVCFGAKGDQFGKFVIEVGGSAKSVKLVYVNGTVYCDNGIGGASKWGCSGVGIGTMLTTSSNLILLPNNQNGAWYRLSGYTEKSPEIVFTDLKNPLILTSGQELRIWYGEDWLNNGGEADNRGTTCADVYAKYH